MTSKRRLFILIAALVGVGIVIAPLSIRAVGRGYIIYKFLSIPRAKARVTVLPTSQVLAAPPSVHPVNLGYATFDTGSPDPVSLEALGTRGIGIGLTSNDLNLAFLQPFAPDNSNPIPVNPREAHPHTLAHLRLLQTNPMAAERRTEETNLLPFWKTLSLNDDDFRLYLLLLTNKLRFRTGADEVQFFENPEVRGIARIGESSGDRRSAVVFVASLDGARMVYLSLTLPETSSARIEEVLKPILGSFRFTADRVDDPAFTEALIREAGIAHKDRKAESDRDPRRRLLVIPDTSR